MRNIRANCHKGYKHLILPRQRSLGDTINQAPTANIDSLIEGTWEWLGDYFPGKLLIGKSH